ncbi:MAG: hypothetical protein HYX24_01195 [Candidatus Aenigmarchaeota archaeon]|nr:hypothetical protein [Candidatus Aenigmarchaeota archaeon]
MKGIPPLITAIYMVFIAGNATAASNITIQSDIHVDILDDFNDVFVAGGQENAIFKLTNTLGIDLSIVLMILAVNVTNDIDQNEFGLAAVIDGTPFNCQKQDPFLTPYPRNFERWECRTVGGNYTLPALATRNLTLTFSLNIAASPQPAINYTLDIKVADVIPPRVASMSIIPIVQPDLVGPGLHSLTVTFNEEMDNSTPLNATFSPIFGPYGTENEINSIENSTLIPNGWIDNRTWRGIFLITASTPNGRHRIRLTGAKDVSGNIMAMNTVGSFVVDTQAPQITAAFSPTVYSSQNLTLSVDAFDRGVGIESAEVEIGSSVPPTPYNLSFGFGRLRFPLDIVLFPPRFVQIESWFTNITAGNISNGSHTATFRVRDRVGNENTTDIQFEVLANTKSIGGKIAFLCRNNPVFIGGNFTCNYRIEDEVIAWLRSKGWAVDVKRYNTWTEAELATRNLIACSDELFACNPRPGSAAYKRHILSGQPFAEIADSRLIMGARSFGYSLSPASFSSQISTNLFITQADPITSGHFLGQPIFASPKRVGILLDLFLRPEAIDLADFGGAPAGILGSSAIFRVNKIGSHGRYLWLGWFSSDALPADLNIKGNEFFQKSVSWTQCGNALGCV